MKAMMIRRLGYALAWGWMLIGVCGCRSVEQDVTYNPYVVNQGRPSVWRQLEAIPEAGEEAIRQLDVRMENALY